MENDLRRPLWPDPEIVQEGLRDCRRWVRLAGKIGAHSTRSEPALEISAHLRRDIGLAPPVASMSTVTNFHPWGF